MAKTNSATFSFNNKSLNMFCVSLQGQDIPAWLDDEVKRAFEALAALIKYENQVIYLRDIKFLAIDGKYPGGHCYNAYEAMIAVPDWLANKQQMVAAINHELHHMARWQNLGYGGTLGGALLSEGIATFYEQLISGWSSPWSQASVSYAALEAAIKAWDDNDYDHNNWFFNGTYGKWTGYGIGYQLAKHIFIDGFNLNRSVLENPSEAKVILEKLKQK